MAGFLSLYSGPERLHVGDTYWIDVKRSLTVEDYETAQRVLLGHMVMEGSGLRAEPDSVGYQTELVCLGIVDWNLTDENGELLPLEPDTAKRASIRRLPQRVFLDVYQRVNDSTTPRTTDDEASFRSGGAGSASGRNGVDS